MLLLACTVTFFDCLCIPWFYFMCCSALYDRSIRIRHFKAPYFVDYKNISCKVPCSWVEISSWVEYILGLHDTSGGVYILENQENLAVYPKIWCSAENRQNALWAWTEKCQDFVLTCLKITITTLFLTLMINFELTLKVVCLFFENRNLLLLLRVLSSGDNCPGLLTSPGLHTWWRSSQLDYSAWEAWFNCGIRWYASRKCGLSSEKFAHLPIYNISSSVTFRGFCGKPKRSESYE